MLKRRAYPGYRGAIAGGTMGGSKNSFYLPMSARFFFFHWSHSGRRKRNSASFAL